jgi:hypothetical protein
MIKIPVTRDFFCSIGILIQAGFRTGENHFHV